jgi:hypothetical protein
VRLDLPPFAHADQREAAFGIAVRFDELRLEAEAHAHALQRRTRGVFRGARERAQRTAREHEVVARAPALLERELLARMPQTRRARDEHVPAAGALAVVLDLEREASLRIGARDPPSVASESLHASGLEAHLDLRYGLPTLAHAAGVDVDHHARDAQSPRRRLGSGSGSPAAERDALDVDLQRIGPRRGRGLRLGRHAGRRMQVALLSRGPPQDQRECAHRREHQRAPPPHAFEWTREVSRRQAVAKRSAS